MIHHPDEKVKLPCGFYLNSDGELSLPGLDEEWFKMNLSENCRPVLCSAKPRRIFNQSAIFN